MSNEQPTEDVKGLPNEVKAITDSALKDLLQLLASSQVEFSKSTRSDALVRFEKATRPPEFHSIVLVDREGNMYTTVADLVASKHQAGIDEETGQQFSEYLTQIDQSREQARAAQVEIDQLRTETRQLIARLFAA
ncbi:MAG TPA: hypothetical protein VGA87_09960 [Pyrinomonadaceae bacterium]